MIQTITITLCMADANAFRFFVYSNGVIQNLSLNNSLVVGSASVLTLSIEIGNAGELALESKMNFLLPNGVEPVEFPSGPFIVSSHDAVLACKR